MSADNYLISIPAKGKRIALYLVSASDSGINLDLPPHEYCKHIAQNYASDLQGTYDSDEDLKKAVDALYNDPAFQIEYPPVFRHFPSLNA